MRSLRQGGEVFAVHSIDLNRFKNVNNRARACRRRVRSKRRGAFLPPLSRPNNLAARFGGDRFVILQGKIPGTFAAGALAERLIASLAAPYDINGHRVLVAAPASASR